MQTQNIIESRARLVAASFISLSWAVMAMSAVRLTAPMSDLHQTADGAVTTHNPYRGAAGTVFDANGHPVALNASDYSNDRWRTEPTTGKLSDVVGSGLLAQSLQPVLRRGLNDFVRKRPDGTPQGRSLLLSLRPRLQAYLRHVTQCFTGDLAACLTLPNTLQADSRFREEAAAPRAAMASIVIVAEDSGEILGAEGTSADCLRRSLQIKVDNSSRQAAKVFATKDAVCSQFPDAKHAYLLGYQLTEKQYEALPPGALPESMQRGMATLPFLWNLPPGSAAKVEVAIACAKAGLLTEPDEFLTAKFATSADNPWFQHLALRCAKAYGEVYAKFAKKMEIFFPAEVLAPATYWPAENGRPGGVANSTWTTAVHPEKLPEDIMGVSEFMTTAAAWSSAQAATERRLGKHGTTRYLNSRLLASIGIGGGGNQASLLAHVRVMRQLGLTSRGITEAPAMHMLRDRDEPIPSEKIDGMPSAQQAARVLRILSGVTAAANDKFTGTAAGACRRVLGTCPSHGLEDLAGKTGTSDFTATENSPLVQQGESMPVKLFVARFAVRGKYYIVAASVLRTRIPKSDNLEFHGNGAAELALLARQHLIEVDASKLSEATQAAPQP